MTMIIGVRFQGKLLILAPMNLEIGYFPCLLGQTDFRIVLFKYSCVYMMNFAIKP